jgi:hypothetical protein
LFAGFVATMAGPDFPLPCIIGFGSSPSRCGPPASSASGQSWDLPVPGQGASAHARVSDRAEWKGTRDILPRRVRGSMAGLCPPLPTLRPCPRGQRRTPRGRCGSLLLHRRGLPPPTPRRSPGARAA